MSEFSITFVFLYYLFSVGFLIALFCFCFVFVSVYIYLYWPKTVNFPVSQSFTFRSLTVGRVIWFFMVEPGLDEIVRIIKNMNINEEQKLIKLRKGHLIVKQNIYISF